MMRIDGPHKLLLHFNYFLLILEFCTFSEFLFLQQNLPIDMSMEEEGLRHGWCHQALNKHWQKRGGQEEGGGDYEGKGKGNTTA